MDIGKFGIWRSKRHGLEGTELLEELGFGALWLGGSPSLEETRPYLEATATLPVITGILNIWQHEPADVAAGHRDLRADFGDRFWLGIGVGHPEATSDYTRPLRAMRRFFDGLDGVPVDERVAAALGPKMLELAGERSLGAHPYFITTEHTRFARERLGAGKLLAPEVPVVLESDPDTARAQAREHAEHYLALSNYAGNLRRFGFTEEDVAGAGSDRLIDAVIPHGTPEAVADAVRAHLEAGADHVCVQVLSDAPEDYRALAEVLLS
jgi:probable F420-dependent oxidoreductase